MNNNNNDSNDNILNDHNINIVNNNNIIIVINNNNNNNINNNIIRRTTTNNYNNNSINNNNANATEDEDRLNQAREAYQNGITFCYNSMYKDAVEAFRISVRAFESKRGIFDEETEWAYNMLGNSYFEEGSSNTNNVAGGINICNVDDDTTNNNHNENDTDKNDTNNDQHYENAINAFRTQERVNIYFDGEVIFSYEFLTSLKKKGIGRTTTNNGDTSNHKDIELYKSNIRISVQLEKDGDRNRIQGNFLQAINNYKEAMKIENDCRVGGTIAHMYLYRKIAFIILTSWILSSKYHCYGNNNNNNNDDHTATTTNNVVGKTTIRKINWTTMDYIDIDKNKKINNIILEKIYQAIKIRYSFGILEILLQYVQIRKIFHIIQMSDDYHFNCQHHKALQCYQKLFENKYKNNNSNKEESIRYDDQLLQLAENNYKKYYSNIDDNNNNNQVTNNSNNRESNNNDPTLLMGVMELLEKGIETPIATRGEQIEELGKRKR